jgi:nucleoside-diphosphate-sugar epimerase
MVLRSTALRGLVLRPGCIYGGRGGLTADFFLQAMRENPVVIGDGLNRWAMVHRDDCADAYVRVGESDFSGEVFNVTDRSRSTTLDMASAAAREVGCPKPVRAIPVTEAAKVMGGMAEALALDQQADSSKLERRLGWQPKHGGFLEGVRTYYSEFAS